MARHDRFGRTLTRLALAVFALPCLALAPPSLPLVPAKQVVTATALLRLSAVAKVKNPFVVAHWLSGQDVFWYARDVANGVEFTLVDAASGAKRRAFDHGAVAAALPAGPDGKPADAAHLPVTAIDGKPDALMVTLSVAGALFDCTPGAAVVCTKRAAPDPALLVSPDGKQGVLVKDHNLWLRDLASGQERALTTDGVAGYGFGDGPDANRRRIPTLRSGMKSPPYQTSWSPDSKRILFNRTDERQIQPYPFVENVPADGSFRPKLYQIRVSMMGDPPVRLEWFVIDAAGGPRRAIRYPADLGDLSMQRTWWRADGRHLIAVTQDIDSLGVTAYAVDTDDGSARPIVADNSLEKRMFDLATPTLPGRPLADGAGLIWFSARDGWAHLYRYDTATGRLINRITSGNWLVRAILKVDEATKTVIFTASGREPGNPYHRYIYRVGFDGSGLRLLTPDVGEHSVIDPTSSGVDFDGTRPYEAVSPSGRYLVYGVSTVAKPAAFRIRRTDTGALVAEFEATDASALFAAGYRPPEEVVGKAADGKSDLWGVVYRPSTYDRAGHYAVIDTQYGSPLVAIAPRNFAAAAIGQIDQTPSAATAELGFVVVVVDARGTPNRSVAFSAPAPGYLQKMGLDDHIAFITQLAKRDPAIDLDRVAISGISFGGWTTVRALIEYPDFYKVGFAGAPPGDFHSMWSAPGLTSSQGLPLYGTSRLRPTPTAVPDAFKAVDSRHQVDRIKGKLLIAQGELDENVTPASPLQFYDAAMKADKDVELLWVPGGTHGGIYSSYALRRTWSFFLANLNGTALPPGTVVASPIPGR